MATRMAARFVSRTRRFYSSGSGKILSEEEKAAENVYIKVTLKSHMFGIIHPAIKYELVQIDYTIDVRKLKDLFSVFIAAFQSVIGKSLRDNYVSKCFLIDTFIGVCILHIYIFAVVLYISSKVSLSC